MQRHFRLGPLPIMRRRCGWIPSVADYLIGRANTRYMLRDYDGALADYDEAVRRSAYALRRLRTAAATSMSVRHDYTRAIQEL